MLSLIYLDNKITQSIKLPAKAFEATEELWECKNVLFIQTHGYLYELGITWKNQPGKL